MALTQIGNSTHVTSLKNAITDITSSRATDRKRGLESLQELLLEDGTSSSFAALDSKVGVCPESKSKGTLWDAIFKAVVTCYEQPTKTTQQLAFTLLQCIIRRVNTDGEYLSCGAVHEFIIAKLNQPSISDTDGYGFMQLLQNVLMLPVYTASFRAKHWTDIILTLIDRFKNSNIPKTMILETLNVSIIHGSNMPEVILVMRREVVQFFRVICLEEQNRLLLPTTLINKGITLLCRYNAIEFRGILCTMGEDIIPVIIPSVSNPVRDHEEETSVIEVLLLQMQIHAPLDLGPSSPAFYADNNDKWDEMLDRIYSFVVDLVEEIARKSGYTKNITIPAQLLCLAVKTTQHIHYRRQREDTHSQLHPPHKRHMAQKSFHNILYETLQHQPCEAAQLVWVQYISAVLNTVPEIVDSSVLPGLHRLGVCLLNSTFSASQEVYIFLRSVLRVEQYLGSKERLDQSTSWTRIWDTAIKFLNASGEKAAATELIRSLLVELDLDMNSLLCAFIEHRIEPGRPSLNLLSELLSRCTLPDYIRLSKGKYNDENQDRICPRLSLLKWIIEVVIEKCIPESELDVARLLISLLVKRSAVFMQLETEFEDSFQIEPSFEIQFELFESCLVQSCFVATPEPKTRVKRNCSDVETELGYFRVLEGFGSKLLTMLQDDLEHSCPPMLTDADFPKRLPLLQYRLGVLLHVVNYLYRHNVGEESELRGNVCGLFESTFKRYTSIVFKFLSQSESQNMFQINSMLELMRVLLQTPNLVPEVKRLLASKYSENILEFWRTVFLKGLSTWRSDDAGNQNTQERSPSKDFSSSTRYNSSRGLGDKNETAVVVPERLRVVYASAEALRCLLALSVICSERRCDILMELFTECEALVSSFSFKIRFHLDLCLDVLKHMALFFSQLRQCHPNMLTLLQWICRTFSNSMDCSVKIWDLFGLLGPVIGKGDDIIRKQFIILVVGMIKRLPSQGVDVTKAAFKSLAILSKCDPLSQWTVMKQHAEEKSMFSVVVDLLKSPSQQVRLAAVSFFCDAFETESLVVPSELQDNLVLQSSVRRKDLFEQVYKTLLEVFHVVGASDEEDMEETVNRTAIVVSCLVRTIFVYPYNQKRVLFSLLLTLKLKAINIKLVHRALKNENQCATKTLSAHILYALEKWTRMKYTIQEFPFLLFDCLTAEEFFVKYRREIGFQLFQCSESNNSPLLEGFSKLMSTSVLALVKECYGMIMSRLILGVGSAEDVEKSGKSSVSNSISTTYNRLIQIFGNVVQAEDYIRECLDELILNMVSLTFDPDATAAWECQTLRIPEPEPPFYKEHQIRVGLEDLGHKLRLPRNISIIGHLAKVSPKKLYRILMRLILKVHDAHDKQEKYWRLHHYSFFVRLIFSEPRDVFEEMRPYICQFTIHSYLCLLKNPDELKDLVFPVLNILGDHVQTLAHLSPDEMGAHFGVVTAQCIKICTVQPNAIPAVKKLLDFLLKTSAAVFSKHIALMDPFPSEIEEFHEYRDILTGIKYGSQRTDWTLSKELLISLEMKNQTRNFCSKERLMFVRQLLSQRKFELGELVTGMSANRFSEDCNRRNDILHSLIQMLLHIITTSNQEELALEACRCLGEIGPIDLAVLVLPSFESSVKPNSAGSGKLIEFLLTSVADYLLSDDINVVATTGEVLESLLRTVECKELIDGKHENASAHIRANSSFWKTLIPFKSESNDYETGKTTSCNPTTLEAQLQSLDNMENPSYSAWVTLFVCGLISALKPTTSLFHRLLPLCKLEVGFCEDVLPFAVYECLIVSGEANSAVRSKLSSYFCKFFRGVATAYVLNSFDGTGEFGRARNAQQLGENPGKTIYTNKTAVRCLLRVIQFLRQHEIPFGRSHKTDWDNNYWLDISYLDLAKAAQFCGAFLSSILYTEIHSYDSSDKELLPQEASLRGKKTQSGEIEKLMLKAYISIGESDAVYGCGPARYSDFTSNVQHLAQMNQWNRSLATFDAVHMNSQLDGSNGISISLKELGLFSTLWTYLQGVEVMNGGMTPELTEIQHECAWRLSKWNLSCDTAVCVYNRNSQNHHNQLNSIPCVQKSIYESIQAALGNDKPRHSDSIRRGLLNVMHSLKHASLESAENLYPFLTQFQTFRIVEDFYAAHAAAPGSPFEPLLGNWQLIDKLGCGNFKFQEPVLYLRSVLLKALNEQQPTPNLAQSYDESLLHLLRKARKAGRLELAETCAASLSSRSMLARKEVEVAKNHWARGEQDIALSILGRFLNANAPDHNRDVYASSLLLYGDWLSETKSENPNTIMEQYFSNSVKLYESQQAFGAATQISKADITLARYADSLYQNVSVYAKSEMYQEKMRTLRKAKAELDQMQAAIDPKDSEGQKSILLLKRQIHLDVQETAAMQTESKRYLTIALKYYLRGLKHSSRHDLLIFRVIGLWLDNMNLKDTLEIFTTESIPSHKYVIVLHQLSARLGLSGDHAVEEVLQKIISTCSLDHPYHAIPVLLAQALMDKDKEYMRIPVTKNTRVDAARHLVQTLKSGKLRELVIRMEMVWEALISLANTKEDVKTSAPKIIGEGELLRKLKSINIVPVPTLQIPVAPNLQYKDSIVGIHTFDVKYALVGGINSPKKILCIGTNGKKYNMLLKGQDDPRQDAVMQQVFAVMNKMLLAETKTKARCLQVRTYKVVPLSQRSGLIEWCEETQTLGSYLIKSHRHYRPNDYEPAECRKKMIEVASKPNQVKLEVFNDITAKFKPVFRHFFFERFKNAGTFFERRLAYTRSVATSSMVGYILGLGDRHVLNILVDLKTAEFIHIDLGVAFEQGKLLPTPETVPFRLTRDVIDGMGLCGVEGDFRRCCEMTLEVLRNNTEIILTILEVLLYDPLYIWTLSDDRVRKVQPGVRKAQPHVTQGNKDEPVPKERNNSAARVLLRLRQKLVGVEEGISSGSTLGVAGHVSFLIQRACDTSRLSRLFPGWQPYL